VPPAAAATRTKAPLENLDDLTAYSRNARDAVSETTAATIDSLVAYTEAAQNMVKELTSLTLSNAKDVYALQRDASKSAFDALADVYGKDLPGQPAFQVWEKLTKVGADVLDRFAEQVRSSVEQGSDKLKDAVDTVAVQVKDQSAKLSSL
jgi:hypothetical protein